MPDSPADLTLVTVGVGLEGVRVTSDPRSLSPLTPFSAPSHPRSLVGLPLLSTLQDLSEEGVDLTDDLSELEFEVTDWGVDVSSINLLITELPLLSKVHVFSVSVLLADLQTVRFEMTEDLGVKGLLNTGVVVFVADTCFTLVRNCLATGVSGSTKLSTTLALFPRFLLIVPAVLHLEYILSSSWKLSSIMSS